MRSSYPARWLACGLLLACSRPADDAPQPRVTELEAAAAPASAASSSSAAPRAPAPPPIAAFVAPSPWQSRKPDSPPIAPPDLSHETWRAYVAQNRPLQKATPRWQPLQADQTVELQMPADSVYRCVVSPLQVTPVANDFDTELKGWSLRRHVVCSSDGFESWTMYPHRDYLRVDGSREVELSSEAFLRTRGPDGTPIETHVLMRSDPEQRAARFGPPRILEGVEVDDD